MRASARVRVLIVVAALAVAGCGDIVSTEAGGGDEVSGPMVSCTRGERDAFPESRLFGDLISREELANHPVGAALATSLPEGGLGPEEGFYSTADGFLMLDDGVIGAMIEGRLVGNFYLEQHDSGWVLQNWGQCSPRRIDGELVAEEWELEPKPAAASRSLEIVVWGGMCSGTDAKTEIVSIELLETTDAVIVTVWTDTPDVDGGCAGLATMIPATITLNDPVGHRRILDGGAVPPTEPR